MCRRLVLTFLLPVVLFLPSRVVEAGRRGKRPRGKGKFIKFECRWVKSLEEAAKQVNNLQRHLYVYFHKPGPRLEGNFYFSAEMQKLSKERLVFVDIVVPKKPTRKLLDLLKRCRVKRLPYAVVADRWGNPLVFSATYKDPKLLKRQAEIAAAVENRLQKRLKQAYEKARAYFEKKRYKTAVQTAHSQLQSGIVGRPGIKKLKELLDRINAALKDKLRGVLNSSQSEREKELVLLRIRAQTHRVLPVYKEILSALKDLRSGRGK